MRSLTLKLTLAFLIVGLTGAALAALFTGRSTTRAFDRMRLEQGQANFIANVTTYYQTNGSWDGVAEYMRSLESPSGQAPPDLGPPPPPAAQGRPLPQPLADQNGRVVLPGGLYQIGDQVSPADVEQGVPLELDGERIGTVIVGNAPQPRDPREEQFIAQVRRALWYAAGGATVIALLLGLALARSLTRPVRKLTAAARAIAQGEFAQQVSVKSSDEIGQFAAAFNQMVANLARAHDLRRQMTADIAHELRTPVSVIAGYAESLAEGVLPPHATAFRAMNEEAQLLDRLIDDLRTLSLADAGELPLSRRSVNVQDLLQRTAAAQKLRAQQADVDLLVTFNPELPPVEADPDRLAQVLGNLVGNALRYTPPGGTITLAAARQNSHVLLTVQDTGAGIPPDKLPHIFERFYRADEARPTHEGGSGLGLAIAKSIVELHGGSISAASAPDTGTAFTIRLPIS